MSGDRVRQFSAAVVMTAAMVLGCVMPAAAQSDEHASVTVAYQVLHIPDKTFPWGVVAGLGLPLRLQPWSLVGEAAWAHDSRNEENGTTAINFFNFGAGFRWTSRALARPYAQLIVGATHATANLRDVGNPTGTRGADSTAFMLQPGVGVAVPLGAKWSGVVQGDYRRSFFSGDGENEVRLLVGLRRSIHGS